MATIEFHAFKAGSRIVKDGSGGHQGQRTIGFEAWGLPAGGGVPGAGDHVVRAAIGYVQLDSRV